MNRRRADTAVGVVVAAVLVFGGAISWQAFQQRRALDQMMGSMMESSMTTAHGTNPLWYVLGTLLIAGVVVGLYLAFRNELTPTEARDGGDAGDASATAATQGATTAGESSETVDEGDSAASTESSTDAEPTADTDSAGDTGTPSDAESPSPSGTTASPTAQSGPRLLDVLPEDERRVLEPVVSSPGITQIELRDRSNFSKSKVSQTVSELEKRGLLYRERQGRTYRIYPSDDVTGAQG